jgi:hypothetical protein
VIKIDSISTKYKVRKIFRKKSVLIALISIFLGLSVATAALTYYGQNVGNFVVGVTDEATDLGLTLSEDPDFAYDKPRLIGPSIVNVKPIGYDMIVSDYSKNADGAYVSENGNYMGYTFYVKNVGEEAVNVELSISIKEATKNVDKVIRAWVFEGKDDISGTVYQKADSVDHDYPDSYSRTAEFVDDTKIMVSSIPKFLPNEVKKYTVIFWIEGEDPDCVSTGDASILEGTIKFSMTFKILEEVDIQQGETA